ncbi:MAG: hypothetical protein J6K57_00315 [Alistipes sp.]|nr:hypothetical protein [Alistipes sp.]
MRMYPLILSTLALLNIACNDNSYSNVQIPELPATHCEVNKPLPAWSEGHLDIHFINAARGECCFYILPDGTTLLVDAGEVVGSDISVPQRPNALIRPYRVYANYIKHFLPKGKTAIDYCAPSHFHIDHIGSADAATETAEAGYRKSGLFALFDEVPYNHILDRAYPTYAEDDVTPPLSGELSQDWGIFVNWGVKEGKFTAERFTPGKEQIVLVNNAEKYSNFSVFNICANGFVWGKDSEGNQTLLGSKQKSGGNSSSCGFHITYGNFDYIACGDLVSTPQNLVAFYFRDFIGEGNLEAFKCHHHLASNSWGTQMQKCNFNPRIVLDHCFTSNKPDVGKLTSDYILPKISGFFATNIHSDIANNSDVKDNKIMDKITAYNGHIVLRVAPGGDQFYVYMLDDTNLNYNVKFICGPYKSK